MHLITATHDWLHTANSILFNLNFKYKTGFTHIYLGNYPQIIIYNKSRATRTKHTIKMFVRAFYNEIKIKSALKTAVPLNVSGYLVFMQITLQLIQVLKG